MFRESLAFLFVGRWELNTGPTTVLRNIFSLFPVILFLFCVIDRAHNSRIRDKHSTQSPIYLPCPHEILLTSWQDLLLCLGFILPMSSTES